MYVISHFHPSFAVTAGRPSLHKEHWIPHSFCMVYVDVSTQLGCKGINYDIIAKMPIISWVLDQIGWVFFGQDSDNYSLIYNPKVY